MVIPFSISIISDSLFSNLWTFQFRCDAMEKKKGNRKEVSEVHCWRDLLRHQRIWPPFGMREHFFSTHLHIASQLSWSGRIKKLKSLHNFPFSRVVFVVFSVFFLFATRNSNFVTQLTQMMMQFVLVSMLTCRALLLLPSRARYKRSFDCNLHMNSRSDCTTVINEKQQQLDHNPTHIPSEMRMRSRNLSLFMISGREKRKIADIIWSCNVISWAVIQTFHWRFFFWVVQIKVLSHL